MQRMRVERWQLQGVFTKIFLIVIVFFDNLIAGKQKAGNTMERITRKQLDYLVNRINEVTGSPLTNYTKTDDGKFIANIGHYYISGAYGGVKLDRICSEGGGCSSISTDGFGTKRQLHTWMRAFLLGLSEKTSS